MSWDILPKNVLQYFLTKLKGLMYTKTEVDNLIPSITPNPSTTTGVLNGLEIDGTAYEIQGGGHTIKNDSGTALPQENNLQFVGVYSNDDSTNGKTKVNIIRKMTRAQLDLLSAEEKKGFIETIDETPSGISSFYRKPDDLQLSIVNGKLCITYDDGT